jgi:hypothetical protein
MCFSLDANNGSLVLYISFPVNEHWKMHPMELRFVYFISGEWTRMHTDYTLFCTFHFSEYTPNMNETRYILRK